MTTQQIVEDIRQRMLHVPRVVGNDPRALPPVDWERVRAAEREQADWENQFE